MVGPKRAVFTRRLGAVSPVLIHQVTFDSEVRHNSLRDPKIIGPMIGPRGPGHLGTSLLVLPWGEGDIQAVRACDELQLLPKVVSLGSCTVVPLKQ